MVKSLLLQSCAENLLYSLLVLFVRRILNKPVPELDRQTFALEVVDEDLDTGVRK